MHGGDIYRNNIQFDFSVNINPMGVPPEVQWVLTEAALHANKYPDIIHERLIMDTADIYSVAEDQIVYGNGASEIIMAICHGLQPKKAMLVAPGFLGYSNCLMGACPKCQIVYHYLQEDNDFQLHHNIVEQILVEKPQVLFLTNPNNPNGALIDKELLDDIIEAASTVNTTVIVDECFLPLTGHEKEMSLIYKLDKYIWELAAAQLAKWKGTKWEKLSISVNVSPKDIYYLDIKKEFDDLVKKYDIPPELIEVEITESALLENSEDALQDVMVGLKNNGFKLLMDDFASGYSSLIALQRLPFDVIKIDKGLIDKIGEGFNREFVSGIIAFLREIKKDIVIEGVEFD